jgi:plasmid maintenance system antidote protein VapI
MAETLRVPARQPTSVGMMLKEEFLAPLSISQGQARQSHGREPENGERVVW